MIRGGLISSPLLIVGSIKRCMKKEIISGIYIIENTINNKVYVGKSQNIKKRWNDHRSCYKRGNGTYPALHNAIDKYGMSSFEFKIAARCPKEYLNKMEKYFIKVFDSYSINGYNCTAGGDGNTTKNPVYKVDLSGNVVEKFNNVSEVYDVCQSSIHKVLKGKRGQAGGFLWCRTIGDIKNKVRYHAYLNERVKNNWRRSKKLSLEEFIINNQVTTTDTCPKV